MTLDLWHESVLTVGSALAVLGFFRSLEQRKDTDFNELVPRLCNRASAVMRATAASQLPIFFNYRRYLLFGRPYRILALELACNALKESDEAHFVRQALADALRRMLGDLTAEERTGVRLIEAKLDRLILHDFRFDGLDMSEASLESCDLGRASFVGTKLWRARLCHSKLTHADLTGAMVWEADFSHADLRNAVFRTPHTSSETCLRDANVENAELSPEVKRCVHS